jgi:gamma-glutamyl hercynylcysteine S-oxide synthase
MSKSAFEDYPRATAVRLVLVMGGAGVLLMIAGMRGNVTTFWAAGAVLVLFAVASWPDKHKSQRPSIEEPDHEEDSSVFRPASTVALPNQAGTDDVESLVERMLAEHRFALLLRPQIAVNLCERQFARAIDALRRHMALVPDGDVSLGMVDESSMGERTETPSPGPAGGHTIHVRRFFLDRCPVTNWQYFEFVAAAGYHQMSLWDESALPAVLEFVDRTGEPGPCFWSHGRFAEGTEDLPVVGVSWYEAAAYARWVGKRLPSDAEWVKAGVWPVPMPGHGLVQRTYPWGDEMDRSRANLWGSGPGEVVAVQRFAGGTSVGGICQLIGNVWEWTGSNFHGGDHPLGKLTFTMPMKSIRGGAFDTYLDNQATCQFPCGDATLSRKRNIGFRLAIGVCDLVLDYGAVAGAAGVSLASPGEIHDGEADPSWGNPEPATGAEVRA